MNTQEWEDVMGKLVAQEDRKARRNELLWVYDLGQYAMAKGKRATDWCDDAEKEEEWDVSMTHEWRRGFWDAEDGKYNPVDEEA